MTIKEIKLFEAHYITDDKTEISFIANKINDIYFVKRVDIKRKKLLDVVTWHYDDRDDCIKTIKCFKSIGVYNLTTLSIRCYDKSFEEELKEIRF